MWMQPENDQFADELYLAGERVAPGTYKQIGGVREIRLENEDFLPASLDGRVACYLRVQNTWAQIHQREPPAENAVLSASGFVRRRKTRGTVAA